MAAELDPSITDGRAARLTSRHPISFVPAQPDDFEALLALRIEAMRESLEHVGRFDLTRARERFRSGYEAEHTWHIVVNGRCMGFVVLKPDADGLLLNHLYIHPLAQGQGIGTAVLAQVFAAADAQALPVRVGALRGSRSNDFYVQHSFKIVEQAEFDNYYVRQCRQA